MEILEIKVSRKTRMIDLPKDFTAIDGENLQNGQETVTISYT